MRSTAYGTISLWLTGSAGVLLVVLAARRVVRRVRGEQPRRREIRLAPRSGSAPGSAPPTAEPPADHRSGDPFPDPTQKTERLPTAAPPTDVTERLPTAEATERLPAARPRPRPGRPRPPEPPRVGSR
jgi:hypothetical protein